MSHCTKGTGSYQASSSRVHCHGSLALDIEDNLFSVWVIEQLYIAIRRGEPCIGTMDRVCQHWQRLVLRRDQVINFSPLNWYLLSVNFLCHRIFSSPLRRLSLPSPSRFSRTLSRRLSIFQEVWSLGVPTEHCWCLAQDWRLLPWQSYCIGTFPSDNSKFSDALPEGPCKGVEI